MLLRRDDLGARSGRGGRHSWRSRRACSGCWPFHASAVWPVAVISVAGLSVAVHVARRCRTRSWLGLLYGAAFFVPLLSWTGTYVGTGTVADPGRGGGGLLRGRWCAADSRPAIAGGAALDRRRLGCSPKRCGTEDRSVAFRGEARVQPGRVAAAVVRGPRRRPPRHVRGGDGWRRAGDRNTGATAGPAVLASGSRRCVAFLVAVPLLGVVLAWPLRPPPDNSGRTATVALVQGNVPDAGLEFNARRRQVLDNHVTQTLATGRSREIGRSAHDRIWSSGRRTPRTSIRFAIRMRRTQITKAVDAIGVPLLVGADRRRSGRQSRQQ